MALYSHSVPRQMVMNSRDEPLADVRGINMADFNIILSRNFDNLDRLMTIWDHYQEMAKAEDYDAERGMQNLTSFFTDVAATAPAVIIDVIALAADATEDEDIEAISKWPMHSQVMALMHIYSLTVVDFGGPAKLLGVLMNLLRDHAPKARLMLP